VRITGAAALVAAALAGCAPTGERAVDPAEHGVAVSAGTPLTRIEPGMTSEQVRNILGSPDRATAYTTGKAWLPFYFGGDTDRTDWLYSDQGRVVFSRNRWSGALHVIRVDYDPAL